MYILPKLTFLGKHPETHQFMTSLDLVEAMSLNSKATGFRFV